MADQRHLLLADKDIAARVEELAAQIAPLIDDETVCVCLLTGGLWFAADLMRALARQDRHPLFDALWLSSYGHGRKSEGQVILRTGLQHEVAGRKVLLVDDVFDTGLSLQAAVKVARDAGAAEVLTAVFASKPWPKPRALTPDFVGWEAPAEFLIGYGLDDAGRFRGLPGVWAVSAPD
jgi:hypoxanthine phosphoribosyltransferase